jgi:hypothetical protein
LNDKPTLQDLLEVQQAFGLPSPALVEKDWYVVRALAAIAALETPPLRLVFGGGAAGSSSAQSPLALRGEGYPEGLWRPPKELAQTLIRFHRDMKIRLGTRTSCVWCGAGARPSVSAYVGIQGSALLTARP